MSAPRDGPFLRLVRALHRLTLRLHPPGFRARFGRELKEAFADHARTVRQGWGRLAIPRLLLWDLPIEAGGALLHRLRTPRTTLVGGGLGGEVRFAVRRLRKRPGLTLATLATLAVTVGAVTAVLLVARAVFLDPFPYEGHERLVALRMEMPEVGRTVRTFSQPELRDLRSMDHVFEHLVAGTGGNRNLSGDGTAERVWGVEVTPSMFPMLGVEPLLGRRFTREEARPGGGRIVLISHRLWVERFGSDPEVVGRALEVDGTRRTVTGVMPPRFRWWGADLWMPLQLETGAADRSRRFLTVHGLLREGLGPETAGPLLEEEARKMEARFGTHAPEYRGFDLVVRSVLEVVIRNLRPTLWALIFAVVVLLLLASANLGGAALADALRRGRELAVRRALGARGWRIGRQLLVEALLLAGAGGLAGFALARWGVRAILGLIPFGYFPAETVVRVDQTGVAVALGVAACAGVLLWIPAARAATGVRTPTRMGGILAGRPGVGPSRRGERLAGALVVAEVALALVLVVGAGLVLRSYDTLTDLDAGFASEARLAARIDLRDDRYPDTEARRAFFRDFVGDLEARLEIREASLSRALPLSGSPVRRLEGDGPELEDGAGLEVEYVAVGPEYFRVMGIPVTAGRGVRPEDRVDATPVAWISERLAERLSPEGEPVGRGVRLRVPGMSAESTERTVVGVVGDVRPSSLTGPPDPVVYVPYAQDPYAPSDMAVVVVADRDLVDAARAFRETLRERDAEQPLYRMQPLDRLVVDAAGGQRLATVLLSVLAGMGVLLGAVGVFALTAHRASRRRREIGLRLALGSSPGEVARTVAGRGVSLAALGVALGLGLALLGRHAFSGVLFGVAPTDPTTLTIAAGLFLAVALLSSWVPARRAARLDPMEALRAD